MLTVKAFQNTYQFLRYPKMDTTVELILEWVMILLILILALHWCLIDTLMTIPEEIFQEEVVQIIIAITEIIRICTLMRFTYILIHTRNVNRIKDNTTREYPFRLEYPHQEINNQFQKHRWSLKSMAIKWRQIKLICDPLIKELMIIDNLWGICNRN